MLSLATQEIDPIASVLSELHPNAQTSEIGSWGILYVVCGVLAGQSYHWMTTVAEIIPTGYEGFRQTLSGEPLEIDIAIEFKNLVLKWAQDSTGLAIARNRLADLERSRGTALPDSSRQHFLDYGRLAIMLNSFSGLDTDDLASIQRWAREHDQGWATLFYSAGILLCVERDFPVTGVGSGLLLSSHSAKDRVKMLMDRYSQLHR